MALLRQLVLRLGVCGSLLLGCCYVYSRLTGASDAEAAVVFGLAKLVSNGVTETRNLDAEFAAVRRRHEDREHMVEQVVLGRLSLQAAALWLQQQNQGWPEFQRARFRDFFAGDTEEESHCQAILALVRQKLRATRPDLERKVLTRLSQELQEIRLRAGIQRRKAPAGPKLDSIHSM